MEFEPSSSDTNAEHEQILYEIQGPTCRISLNRARYRNAQSRLLLEQLDVAFSRAVADREVRVIVLAGIGEHFSSGHDLGTEEERQDALLRPYPAGPEGDYDRSIELYVEFCLRWRDLPKPCIAEVQGLCIYGGFMIASVMDFIVAADDAIFLPSHLQLFTCPWLIGCRKTKEILFEGRFVDAEEAERLGMVSRIVRREQLSESVMAQAGRIAENDGLTLKIFKLSTNLAEDSMGYRTATRAAHGNYMILQNAGVIRQGGERQLTAVKRALDKL